MSLFERLPGCDDAILPMRKTVGSAGYDIYNYDVDKTVVLSEYASAVTVFRTGLRVNIPSGYCGQFWCKSSLGLEGLIVHAGLIDSDYNNELLVLLSSLYRDYTIVHGGKLCQLVIVPYYKDDSDSEVCGVRVGGFGSTDKVDSFVDNDQLVIVL